MTDAPDAADRAARIRSRREPPPLRPVTVVERMELTPRMLRLTFAGDGLRELIAPEPAASVRLLVPSPGAVDLVMPVWNGNEFLLPDGERPALRTFTPLRFDGDRGRLDLEIVRHPGGAVSSWAEGASPGTPAAISGPGRGFEPPEGLRHLVILGDETALPAISQLLHVMAPGVACDVHAEIATDAAVVALPRREGASVSWHQSRAGEPPGSALVAAARGFEALGDGAHVWAAGEAASVQAIRRHFFDKVGLSRSQATIRGYWKPARG